MTKVEKNIPTIHEKRGRILSLDLIRGLFLLIILADHLAWSPSFFFQIATANSALFASAAEGFFMISGVLVGYIYGPRILKSTKAVIKKIWKRAALLYFLGVFFAIFYTLWSIHLLPEPYPRFAVWPYDKVSLLFNTLGFRYQYGWTDFLPRYAVLMFIAPLVLWLIAKGKAWLVAAASIVVWLAFSHDIYHILTIAAWQLIFVFGIIAGYYLPSIEKFVRDTSNKYHFDFARVVIVLAVSTYILVLLVSLVIPTTLQYASGLLHPNLLTTLQHIEAARQSIMPYFDKSSMAWGRVALGTLWFTGLYFLFRRHESFINKNTFGVLDVYGKNSLFVYCFQAFFIFTLDVLFWPPFTDSILLNTLIGFMAATITYLVTRYKDAPIAYIRTHTYNLYKLARQTVR